MKTLSWLALAGAVLCLGLFAARSAAAAEACAPEGKVHYVCGLDNVEDLVLAPGSRWIIASGMSGPSDPAGHLYAIDSAAKTFIVLTPDVSGAAKAPYEACPGPPDLARLAPHGVAVRPSRKDPHTLYVVNHGGRETVEVFELGPGAGPPSLSWIGCVPMPANGSGNAVAPLADGGFVVTKFQDAGDPEAFNKMAATRVTGGLYRWSPGSGFQMIPESAMSGANGVEVSADGRWLVANAWPEKRVVRFDLQGKTKPVSIHTPFLPDNVRAAPGGVMLVAGQDSDMKTLLSCKTARCPHAWTIARLNPLTMKLAAGLHVEGTAAFSDATSGLQVGKVMWAGTYRGDRVAWVDLP